MPHSSSWRPSFFEKTRVVREYTFFSANFVSALVRTMHTHRNAECTWRRTPDQNTASTTTSLFSMQRRPGRDERVGAPGPPSRRGAENMRRILM